MSDNCTSIASKTSHSPTQFTFSCTAGSSAAMTVVVMPFVLVAQDFLNSSHCAFASASTFTASGVGEEAWGQALARSACFPRRSSGTRVVGSTACGKCWLLAAEYSCVFAPNDALVTAVGTAAVVAENTAPSTGEPEVRECRIWQSSSSSVSSSPPFLPGMYLVTRKM